MGTDIAKSPIKNPIPPLKSFFVKNGYILGIPKAATKNISDFKYFR